MAVIQLLTKIERPTSDQQNSDVYMDGLGIECASELSQPEAAIIAKQGF
jgi:hypothetical protein